MWRQRSVQIICTAAYSVIVLSQDCMAPVERTDYMHSCIQCYRVITRLSGASGAYRLYAQLHTVLSCYHKTVWRQRSIQIICTAAYGVITRLSGARGAYLSVLMAVTWLQGKTACMHLFVFAPKHMHTHTHTHSRPRTLTLSHTCTQTHITCTPIHTHSHTDTHRHTDTTHTQHTHTQPTPASTRGSHYMPQRQTQLSPIKQPQVCVCF